MKILAITPQFLPVRGGIEVFSAALVRALQGHGIETAIVTDLDPGSLLPQHEILDGISVHRLPFMKTMMSQDTPHMLRLLRQFLEIVAAIKPDLIHMHSAVQLSAWFVDRLIGKLSPCPALLVTQHGVLEAIDRQSVVRSLLLRADMLTAVSEAALQSSLEFSGRQSGTVIYNGVRPLRTAPRPPRAESPFSLLCVGRIQAEKGFDLAVRALADVRTRGIDATLTIVGQGHEKQQLIELAAALGVADHVTFPGVLSQQDTWHAMACSDLLLVPSRTREGFGLVVVEAALSGLPCIAARLGGLPETVEDGVTGLLVPPDDHRALADAIVELSGQPARLKTLGNQARRRSLDKFDMDRCAAQYVQIYRQLTRG